MSNCGNIHFDGDSKLMCGECGPLEYLHRMGRNEIPNYLEDAIIDEIIAVEDLRPIILEVWDAAEWPCRFVPAVTWVEWFRELGFVSDGTPKPSGPTTVWRAQVENGPGLSWTPDREVAEWFHQRNVGSFGFRSRILERITNPEGYWQSS